MTRGTYWTRALLAIVLPVLALSMSLLPARGVGAVGCGDTPLLAAPAMQTQERWRSVYGGAGSFSGSAQVFIDELIFTPSLQEEPAPTVTGIDLATGAVEWSNNYPEFSGVFIAGQAAGIVLATGDTAEEALLPGLAS